MSAALQPSNALPARAKKWDPRTLFSWIWLAIGVALLAYVGYEYASMHFEQQSLSAQWERQNAQATRSAYPAAPLEDELTRLSIPKIGLDAVIVEGTSHRQLTIAPGHVKGTSLPGDDGNAVISAHRDTFFRHIYELQKGDGIVVRRGGHVFNFQVTGKKIVDPDDISVIQRTPDAELTLLTCYPTYYIGPAPERLVVFSKLVPNQNAVAPTQAAAKP